MTKVRSRTWQDVEKVFFLDWDILIRWAPLNEASEFVINSTDGTRVTAADATLSGRCFRRRRAP